LERCRERRQRENNQRDGTQLCEHGFSPEGSPRLRLAYTCSVASHGHVQFSQLFDIRGEATPSDLHSKMRDSPRRFDFECTAKSNSVGGFHSPPSSAGRTF
jgi:hypothetical protein